MSALVGAALLIGAVTALAVLRTADDSTVDAGGPAPVTGVWTRLPDPPLRPRVGASAAWTGEEIVVVGGWEFLCPPNASCVGPTEAPFTDGAAFDPSAGTWRRIADAPAAFEGAMPVVVNRAIYVLVDCSPDYGASDGQPPEDRCPQSTAPTALLRYDAAPDSWIQFPGPPDGYHHALAGVADSVVAFAGSEEGGEQREWRFHPSSGAWSELPDDPLPLMYDRSIVAANEGWSILLLGADAEAGPTTDPGDESNLAARLDLDTMTWTELPSSPNRGYRAWGVDDVVVLEPHFGGTGALFEPATGFWSSLPDAGGRSTDSNRIAGAVGGREAVYVDSSGWVFDAGERRWSEVPPIDDRNVFPPSSVTAVGRDLFVYGGERWTSSDGELLGDAWMWVAR